jgi:hypothetical protein
LQDYRCAHSVTIDAGQWPDDVRLSDLEPKFTCRACGQRGADVRPCFEQTHPVNQYPHHQMRPCSSSRKDPSPGGMKSRIGMH